MKSSKLLGLADLVSSFVFANHKSANLEGGSGLIECSLRPVPEYVDRVKQVARSFEVLGNGVK